MLRCDQTNTWPVIDPVSTVVLQADTRNVDTVFVAGRAAEARRQAGRRRPAAGARPGGGVARLPARAHDRPAALGAERRHAALSALTSGTDQLDFSRSVALHSPAARPALLRPECNRPALQRSVPSRWTASSRLRQAGSHACARSSLLAVAAASRRGAAPTRRSSASPVRIAYLSFARREQLRRPDARRGQGGGEGARREDHGLRRRTTTRRSSSRSCRRRRPRSSTTRSSCSRSSAPQLITGVKSAIKDGDQGREHRPEPRHESRARPSRRSPGLSGNVVFVPTTIGHEARQARRQGLRAAEGSTPARSATSTTSRPRRSTSRSARLRQAAIGGPQRSRSSPRARRSSPPRTGLKAAQTMLQAHPDLNLIVGADQGIEGAHAGARTGRR